jgi:hypothetical protein
VALQRGFSARGVAVGIVPPDPGAVLGAVGVAMSPGGQLYVTTLGGYGPYGQLWVIDTARAESGDSKGAVLVHVPAGCRINEWNKNPRPFICTKAADDILETIAEYCQ